MMRNDKVSQNGTSANSVGSSVQPGAADESITTFNAMNKWPGDLPHRGQHWSLDESISRALRFVK